VLRLATPLRVIAGGLRILRLLDRPA
jgi:hypothetical protein